MINTVRDYLLARLGVPTTPRASPVGSVLGLAVAQILRQDPRRVGFIFINLSPNQIFISPIGAPSAANGIRVGPNGGSVHVLALEDGEMTAWEWAGMADLAGSNYFILEILLATEAEVA